MKHLSILVLLSTPIIVAQDDLSHNIKCPPCEQKVSTQAQKAATKNPTLQKYPPCEERSSTPVQKIAAENPTLQMERIEEKVENLLAMLTKIEKTIKNRTTESTTKEN